MTLCARGPGIQNPAVKSIDERQVENLRSIFGGRHKLIAGHGYGTIEFNIGPASIFAFINFGHASVFPIDTVLEGAPPRDDLFGISGAQPVNGRNPFTANVLALGATVQRYIRIGSSYCLSRINNQLLRL